MGEDDDMGKVDVDKLVKAFEMLADIQRDLVKANLLNEASNRRTRRFVLVASMMMVATCVLGYFYLVEQRERSRSLDDRLHLLADNVESTSRAVRATSEAIGAKVEADSDEPEVRGVAIEAQREAIAAEMKVASDPADKAEAAAKLVEVESKAAKIDADQQLVERHLEETRKALEVVESIEKGEP